MDEFALIAAGLHADGRVVARRADDGAELGGTSLRTADDAAAVTAVAAAFDGPEVALGFADGTVRLGTIDFDPGFTDAKLAPGERAAVEPAGPAAVAAVAEGAAGGLTRVQTLRVEPAADSIRLGDGPVRALDLFEAGGGPVVAGWSDGTGLVLWSGGAAIPLPMPPGRGPAAGRPGVRPHRRPGRGRDRRVAGRRRRAVQHPEPRKPAVRGAGRLHPRRRDADGPGVGRRPRHAARRGRRGEPHRLVPRPHAAGAATAR